jgi:hypothetical protein
VAQISDNLLPLIQSLSPEENCQRNRQRLVATRRQVIQDVTRRQGCASRRGRYADTGPGARVMALSLPPPGSVALALQADRPPAAAVARCFGARLRPLEAAVVAAFFSLDDCSALG